MNEEWKIASMRLFDNNRAAQRCDQLLETKVKPLIFKKFCNVSKEVLLDCWSEARLILLQYLKAGIPIDYPRAFLLKLTYNKLRDYWKSKQYGQNKREEIQELRSVCFRAAFEEREFLQYLFAKANISLRDQRLLLKQKEGYSNKELALEFELSPASVKVIRSRAMQKLREAI